MSDIDIDDIQECIDDCNKGKRTRQNMKAVIGLIYKFGIPRNCIPNNLNLAEFIIVGGGETARKVSFTAAQIEVIRNEIDSVPYADYIYCLIYLGFRPSEFLALDVKTYDRKEKALTGGSKTEAGINRIVTISPKIQPIIDGLVKNKISGAIFCDPDGKKIPLDVFRNDYFYPTLEKLGIDNPIAIVDGKEMHKYTPHSCRHTFATLIKKVTAPDKDKLELIGHTSEEMLRYYQDVSYEDLRKITDAI